jgi:hypothetical protein
MVDFTGVPAVVDLAAMRDAMKSPPGGDPKKINPLVPVHLVIGPFGDGRRSFGTSRRHLEDKCRAGISAQCRALSF